MSTHHQSSADAVMEEIFRWPMEAWTRRKISFLLSAHRIRHRSADTKPQLREKLFEWAEDRCAADCSTERIKKKARRAFKEFFEAGYDVMTPSASMRRYNW
ncbi:hypothetical protein VTL71DRAFT_5739 [Oculimacula yallundae]|uniref:Uncharacterized protein n=1 Tax=Oculimacula yallundae TaxID=86028 RepID=A0ABR4BZ20_9HELO